jgi:hypothetical protein
MSMKSTANGINSAVPCRGVYSSANASLDRPRERKMLIPLGAMGFQASRVRAVRTGWVHEMRQPVDKDANFSHVKPASQHGWESPPLCM